MNKTVEICVEGEKTYKLKGPFDASLIYFLRDSVIKRMEHERRFIGTCSIGSIVSTNYIPHDGDRIEFKKYSAKEFKSTFTKRPEYCFVNKFCDEELEYETGRRWKIILDKVYGLDLHELRVYEARELIEKFDNERKARVAERLKLTAL